MKLHEAFDVTRGDVVAFIGAGGKTSALVGLGYELMEAGWRVLATTTHHTTLEQLDLFPAALSSRAGSGAISQALTDHGFVFLYESLQGQHVNGIHPTWTRHLLDSVDSDVLLIEADFADGKPLKAPYDDEPRIPDEASLIIPVASLAALDQPLNEANLYNAQAMIDRYGFGDDAPVRSPWLAQVLRDEELGLKGVPENKRVVAFINQTPDKGYMRSRARLIAKLALKSDRFYGVALGSVRAIEPVIEVQRPIGAVVLAAGQSSRMGQAKVLLPWENGKTIIEHIIEQLMRSRVDQINVVTGYYADQVRTLAKPMGVKVVHNRSHKTGEMLSSLKTGLRAMPAHVAAALVVLGDQPRIQPRVIYDILKTYAEGGGDIIIPSYEMRRGHPILIARRYWGEIMALPRDGAPRDVINKYAHRITYVNVDTDSVLRDVDTPDDYQRERKKAGLHTIDIKRVDNSDNPNS